MATTTAGTPEPRRVATDERVNSEDQRDSETTKTQTVASSTSEDQVINFIEHCLLVASGSPQASDGHYISKALELVADAFWPDLTMGAHVWFEVEAGEIIVETTDAAVGIKVREVKRSTSHEHALAKNDHQRAGPA